MRGRMPKKEDCGTLLSYRPSIRVLDATLRDGGLVNGFRFSDAEGSAERFDPGGL